MQIILPDGTYYLSIDNICFKDKNNDITMCIPKNGILQLLTDFYWELDEIYIYDFSYDWFISINHNFELHLYCDDKSVASQEILSNFEKLT